MLSYLTTSMKKKKEKEEEEKKRNSGETNSKHRLPVSKELIVEPLLGTRVLNKGLRGSDAQNSQRNSGPGRLQGPSTSPTQQLRQL